MGTSTPPRPEVPQGPGKRLGVLRDGSGTKKLVAGKAAEGMTAITEAGRSQSPLAPCSSPVAPPSRPFAGREEAEVEAAGRPEHGSARLLTLRGPAGPGKTGVAQQAVDKVRRGYLDGVVLVDLWPPDGAEAVLACTASALGPGEQGTRRVLETSVNQLPGRRVLGGGEHGPRFRSCRLQLDDIAPPATALGEPGPSPDVIRLPKDSTGGHTLHVRGCRRAETAGGRLIPGPGLVPASPAAAIGDQLASLPAPTRSLVELLAVLDRRMPLALLGDAAGVREPSSAVEPAVQAGLVDWWPHNPTCPIMLRDALRREVIYASLSPTKRRELHGRAVELVDEGAAWSHRVASADQPDEALAAQLERLADEETAQGNLVLASTHLQWASDISPERSMRERRLLQAASQLMMTKEDRGLTLRPAVEMSAPSALRGCVLGTMALASGELGQAESLLSRALADARSSPGDERVAVTSAARLGFAFALRGEGAKVVELGHWALGTGCLPPAAQSEVKTLIAIGTSHVGGPLAGLAELKHIDPDPARVEPLHIDGLASRGILRFLAGDLASAVTDLSASLKLARNGANFTIGLQAHFYLALAQYISGAWDDALISAEQGLSAAAVHPRRYELPLLHLAAACVPAGRGAGEDAALHAKLAQECADSLAYRQEKLYAGMARALVCQSLGNYEGMVDALVDWQGEGSLDGRSRMHGALWRPLLVEGLVGSGRLQEAAVELAVMREDACEARFLVPAAAWLEGWLAEHRGAVDAARQFYQAGEDAGVTECPLHTARLLLAHGRCLRRTGQRRLAVERLRRAAEIYVALGASPFIAQTEEELSACGLPQAPAGQRSVLDLTNREAEVAHLVARRMTNNEIAAELFVSPSTVEYHLGNIYAKLGVRGRQQLRRALADRAFQLPSNREKVALRVDPF